MVRTFVFAWMSPGDDIEALKKPFDDFLAAAGESAEGRSVVALRQQFDEAGEELQAQLVRIGALHVIRGRCDLCSRLCISMTALQARTRRTLRAPQRVGKTTTEENSRFQPNRIPTATDNLAERPTCANAPSFVGAA
jgi:hypothetical protein